MDAVKNIFTSGPAGQNKIIIKGGACVRSPAFTGPVCLHLFGQKEVVKSRMISRKPFFEESQARRGRDVEKRVVVRRSVQ